MTDRELMRQALEKLEFFERMRGVSEDTRRLITALRQALEQPKVWVTPKLRPLARLANELDGVIADVEQGDGFDGVCLETVRYVRDALAEQPAQEPDQRFVNLLCRIHRDGGHYIAEHGFDKAVADADIKVAELNSMSDTGPQAREPLAWQPIETAPKDSKARLVWCPDRQNTYAASRYKDGWCIFGGSVLREVPTHWMPLPAPPIEAAHGIKGDA